MKSRNKAVVIGDTEINPGERVNVSLPVADLYTSTSLSMPVQVICGRKAGPVLFICAAIHGDELNGVEIIRRLLKRKILRSLRGTLLAVPIVNVHGFLDQSRYLPDRRDLNRSFPGSPKGSIAARLANTFNQQILSNADFGIDLHTGAINRTNLPQIRANLDDAQTLDMAKAFGAPVIINSNIRDGSLRQCASDRGMPILIYEAGEALRFDETSIRAGIRGIFSVMRHLGMLPASKQSKPVTPIVARSTQWVRAGSSGIVSGKVKLGSTVKKGQRLATISDPLGDDEENVVSPFDGIVIGRINLPLAHEGDALFNLSSFADVPKAADVVETFASTHQDQSAER
ncbi:MAG: succinylglutamate desuccinylase/aspartoacylase family protein [Gammaproteobacteria bacterium]|nr:succinylglutamate desuccinylase/aspartoacylase family protein [Gammaproteobacteria bacterium]NNL51539.1 succinylglutamate desuccinylase [Woeseiaceae bacterium]